MHSVTKKLREIGIVPVVKINNVKDAVPLAGALISGGIPCAEITFRTSAAKDAIKAITTAFPDMLVGAGTVLTTTQADEAIEAGASFIVSPGFNKEVVQHCINRGILIIPGIISPSEAELAMSLNLQTVKFFPAEAAGGLAMIKAMSAPYSSLSFMPTGGIDLNNLNSYLDFSKVIACGGSFMVDAKLIDSGDFKAIERLTKEAMEKMLGFKVTSLCVRNDGVKSDEQKFGEPSWNDAFSFIKNSEQNEDIIVIETNYLDRAAAYLKNKGFTFSGESHANTLTFNEKLQGKVVVLKQK